MFSVCLFNFLMQKSRFVIGLFDPVHVGVPGRNMFMKLEKETEIFMPQLFLLEGLEGESLPLCHIPLSLGSDI